MADPISLIVGALAAGANVAGDEVVRQAVQGMYQKLKNSILAKFSAQSAVGATLQTLELSPESREIQDVAKRVFLEAGVEQDKEVLAQADALRIKLEQANLWQKVVYQGKLEGSGALAQGEGAVAAGAGGIAVGGNVHRNVTPGENPGQS